MRSGQRGPQHPLTDYTGAEIEQIVVEGLYAAFVKGDQPNTLSMSVATGQVVPLSKTTKQQATSRRLCDPGIAGQSGEHEDDIVELLLDIIDLSRGIFKFLPLHFDCALT